MRVSPSSRSRSRTPVIWLALMIGCSLISLLTVSLMGPAARGFDAQTLAASDQRINILLLGIDQRAGESEPARTDTLLVLTIDPRAKTAGMLSINRDLWVKIPGQASMGKINTAHFLGEAEHYPGGGPTLAMQTAQAALDIPLPYYIRLNFAAFEKLIDLIGGIDILVEEPIDDPTYPDAGYGYEPLYLDAGWQHMDGHTALRYARTRATAGSDLDRVKRQQQVVLAVRDKILDQRLLPRLLPQIALLIQTLRESVQTNLSPRQIYRLVTLAGAIERDRITAVTLDRSLVAPQTIDGQAVLVLNPGAAQLLRDRLYQRPGPDPS
jgi:LCP family protein required for cell wall assembly